MFYKIEVKSKTLNGEVSFDKDSDVLSFLKLIKRDAFIKSEPITERDKYFGTTTRATKQHPLKIIITKL